MSKKNEIRRSLNYPVAYIRIFNLSLIFYYSSMLATLMHKLLKHVIIFLADISNNSFQCEASP